MATNDQQGYAPVYNNQAPQGYAGQQQQYPVVYAVPSGVEGQPSQPQQQYQPYPQQGYPQQQQQPVYGYVAPNYVQVPGQPSQQPVMATGAYPTPQVAAVPMNVPIIGGVAQGRIPYGVWSDNLCDCCSHFESCLFTYFCLPFRWARTVERSRLNTFGAALALYGLPWVLLMIFFFVNWGTVSSEYGDQGYSHNDRSTDDVSYLGWAAWLCFACNIFMTWIGVVYRQKLRAMYHIPGSGLEDCLLHTFCRLCAVAQEARHVDRDTGAILV